MKAIPRKNVLVVGQTPPPYHGQAIMIQNTINHNYDRLRIFHIRMNFSESIDEIGRFNIRKIVVMAKLIFCILKHRFIYGVKTLYYPPAGPDLSPILRDIIILGSTRWAFKRTILHFRAGGISEKLEQVNPIIRFMAKQVFSKPDLSIRLSKKNPEDGKYFLSKKDIVIPNGLKDFYKMAKIKETIKNKKVSILYVGAIKETKGVYDLLAACSILKQMNIEFVLKLVGQFDVESFKKKVLFFVKSNGLKNNVFFLGTKIDNEKWIEYASADIFCFPSYYECETFGNVLVEAMQFSLPIVATRWRGIPDIVEDNKSGFLVDINSPKELANKLETLILNSDTREVLGRYGRVLFEKKFKEETYFKNFEEVVYVASS